ncbi:hypothetical protein ACWDYK_18135 [Streptomyces anthocyanicus]|uniref:hypothetical protein n=2 Tax=Streptomyces anthocyanicus TaxID=68174 RepID=UPI0032466871|nr:hypothetical protein OHA15_40420 [Streptomyces anthocyanicus]
MEGGIQCSPSIATPAAAPSPMLMASDFQSTWNLVWVAACAIAWMSMSNPRVKLAPITAPKANSPTRPNEAMAASNAAMKATAPAMSSMSDSINGPIIGSSSTVRSSRATPKILATAATSRCLLISWIAF